MASSRKEQVSELVSGCKVSKVSAVSQDLIQRNLAQYIFH